MIKLGRIRIENFKSFLEPISFDFNGKDLVLFDGPNGFGKTTIFDAVELCFTGTVSRIKETDSKVKSDHILKGNNKKPTSIELELLNGDETLIVIGISIPANTSGINAKVSNYKDVIERFETEQWQDDLVNNLSKKTLDVEHLKRLLKNEKLDSTFTLFNYIQQEETCHFLKLKEDKRHQKISYLFGTFDEQNKADKLNLLSAKLKEKIDIYNSSIIKEETELSELSKPASEESDEQVNLGSGKISIFSDLSSSTLEQLEAYKNNLEGVEWVLNNYSEFKNLQFNNFIKIITTKRTIELDNCLKFGVIESYAEIQKLNKHYSIWQKVRGKADNYNKLIKFFDEEPNTVSKDILNKYQEYFPVQYNKRAADVTSFDDLSKASGSLSSLLIKIEDSRKNLLSHYKNHLNPDENVGIPCPFCGDPKSKWQDLLDEYQKQSKFFNEQLGDNGRLLTEITKKLIVDLVEPLVSKMRRFVTRYDKYISFDFEKFIKIKHIEKTDFERMETLKNWLESNIGDCSQFFDNTLYEINQNYVEVKEQFITFINSYKKTVLYETPKSYVFFAQDFKDLNLDFDDNKGLAVELSDISKDLDLLSRLIVQQNSNSYRVKVKKISNLKSEVKILSQKRTEITSISYIFKQEIKSYERDVAKHIAIPLFVYSSKILQARPEGSGIFLITPDSGGLKGFMQFSATPYDSHDAWNTMSSGQLSGVVISFMLAMNKVYPSNLSTLMIDDPVQTMDEVNMASFVQVMKYDFREMQVLLSTHETKVANYFNYKYKEAGLSTLPINMKNRRLELTGF